ncbi:MAG: hypothetical protein EXX96DRAFT_551812 [Benjaminiella poitrasii]|nr:MAG: hypothetical protein EXX96DRAFT_551812 [Benjaminiella poitrasii]
MNHLSLELIELIAGYCLCPKDKASLCQVNHLFYTAIIRLLYKHIMITSPRQYLCFKESMRNDILSKFVRRLDLSSYTARGSRWTEEKAKQIIVADELSVLIANCHHLRELYIGEEMMHVFASPKVIQTIFNQQNNLSTIDLTGFCDRSCTSAMADFFKPKMQAKLERLDIEEDLGNVEQVMEEVICDNWLVPKRLEDISFYMCMALSQDHFFIPFFEKLSVVGNQLKKLDLAYTQVTSNLFLHLAKVTRLTHLNLQGCHSLSCCSPLIPFLLNNCRDLQELNMNMDFNGIGGSRFCRECVLKIVKFALFTVQSLDMGGHTHLDCSVLNEILATAAQKDIYFTQLRYFSIAYCPNIGLDTLKQFLVRTPNLFYLNLARTPFTIDVNYLPFVLRAIKDTSQSIKVIEISPFSSRKYPIQIEKWKLVNHGRRSYYALEDIDPKFVYSKKIILSNNQQLSPMNKYWCYSY